MENNNSYDYSINELNEIHKKYPQKTEKELNKIISKLEMYDETNSIQKIINHEEFDTYALIAIFLIIALLGLVNFTETIGLYYFGFVFFIAGFLIGISGDKMTLIFLFSHGIMGFCLMTIPIIYPIFDSPIMSDNPTNIYIYLGIMILLSVIATIYAIMYNTVKYIRLNNHAKLIPLIIYLIVIIMAVIFPKIYLNL